MNLSATRKTRDIHEIVLQTAIHLFTQQGYFNTSVPDIVREAGVSTGSIYHHFGDKEGITKALFNMLLEKQRGHIWSTSVLQDKITVSLKSIASIYPAFS